MDAVAAEVAVVNECVILNHHGGACNGGDTGDAETVMADAVVAAVTAKQLMQPL
jgi:hypothetical protein